MSILKGLLGVAAGKKLYETTQNRPMVIPPDGYVVKSLKHRGLGSEWVVRYSKKDSLNMTSSFNITATTRSVSVGRDTFHIEWP